MRKLIIICLFIECFTSKSFCQFNCFDTSLAKINNVKVHNVVGFIPSNARVTNGLGVGWSTTVNDYCAYMDSIRINGLYANISPFQVFVAGMGLVMIPFALVNPRTYKKINSKDTSNYQLVQYDTIYIKHKINGVSISLFDFGEEFTIQGLQITGLYHEMLKLNGVSVTTLGSYYKHFNGVMVSGFVNKTYKGNGVQIGLVNIAQKMNGVQIGLWNKIGSRGFPFINFKFRN